MIEELIKYATLDNSVFILVSLFGMLGHAIKKFVMGQLSGSLANYIFDHNKKRTILAVLTTIGTSVGLILGGQIPTQVGAFLLLAFTTGFTSDSTINKD